LLAGCIAIAAQTPEPPAPEINDADRVVAALLAEGKGGAPSALELARNAVRARERSSGAGDLVLARSLDNLGATYIARGEYASALPHYERALDIRSSTLPEGDARFASSLAGLAHALIRLERFEAADPHVRRLIAISKAHSADAPLEYADALELAAMLPRYRGDFAAAREPLDQALDIRRRLTPESAATASLLNLAGEVAYLTGDMTGAAAFFAEALRMAERTLPRGHPATSLYMRRHAQALWAFGDVSAASSLRHDALAVAEESLPPCHPDLSGAFNDLAASLFQAAEYVRARTLFERALAAHERCLGPEHSLTGTAVFNLAILTYRMGELTEAERLFRRAIQVWSAGLGSSHPFVARATDTLASLLASRGQPARARRLHLESLALRRKTLGNAHPDVAQTLRNLAQLEMETKNLSRALAYLNEADLIYAGVAAADEPLARARLAEMRGLIQQQRGDLQGGRSSLATAIQLVESQLGRGHASAAVMRAELAHIDLDRGAYDAALDSAIEAEQSGREVARSTIRSLAERASLTFSEERPSGLPVALAVASRDAAHASRVYDALIRSRGIVLDELASRAQALAALDRRRDPRLAAAVGARQRYANLLVRSFTSPGSVAPARLDDARREQEAAESVLAQEDEGLRLARARETIGLAEVRDALPPGAALVSFARYDRPAGAAAYIAFVARAGSRDVKAIALGRADLLDAAVERWRREASGGSLLDGATQALAERLYREAGERLRTRAWDPIAPHIAGATRVLVVPDGALNVVTFASLPSAGGRFLVEDGAPVHYAATERDFVRLAGTPDAREGTLLAVGGPAFDDQGPRAPSRTRVLRQFACDPQGSLRFEPLPATSREVEDIAAVWSGGATVLTGAAAGERALKEAAGGRRVLHFATHGFLLGSPCAPAPTGARAVGGLATPVPRPAARSENPLLLAGLALAGANRRSSQGTGEDDGILTAEEVAGLNLQGTEWAVLSACDTGLGQIRASEGVLGLRRAFQIAGVRTVIMSLWSVDDEATRAWMRALYEGRFRMNLDTPEAIRGASNAVLASRRLRGQSTHPFYWAAFVAAGDWR
jgi:CHAT domain-containing protein/tetratricopeptide (TPR) repeat protein